MRKLWIGLALFALVAAFLAGFWPQWNGRRLAERESATARVALEEAQQQLRLCRLQNRLSSIVMAAQAHNFGIAAEQAQRFLAEIETLTASAAPETRTILDRARPRAKEMAEVAQRLDPQVPLELSRMASELTTVLAELERVTPTTTATPR
jgi:signal transduction histidine kinase